MQSGQNKPNGSTLHQAATTLASKAIIQKAQGCLLGQVAGDSLGSLVEFKTEEQIRSLYPDGVRRLADGGTFNTLAGQPTDDSEMALGLARLLVQEGRYHQKMAKQVYIDWLNSGPFDCGMTISSGLRGNLNYNSQANGAMMRISPLAIFGAGCKNLEQVAEWARQDAVITHPHPVCLQANSLYVMAITTAINKQVSSAELYEMIIEWAKTSHVEPALLEATVRGATSPPANFSDRMGWVLIAWQNCLWQLLHAENLEEAVVDTVMRGGDTDTNGAICGALLGAVHGLEAIPGQWKEAILTCRPQKGLPRVHHPRPQIYWPDDVLGLAEKLVLLEPK